jgi:3-dehydroquinate synthase
MLMASDLSARAGSHADAFVTACGAAAARGPAHPGTPALGIDRLVELMRVDKKAEAGEIRFVVIEAPGARRRAPAPDDGARRDARHSEPPAAP